VKINSTQLYADVHMNRQGRKPRRQRQVSWALRNDASVIGQVDDLTLLEEVVRVDFSRFGLGNRRVVQERVVTRQLRSQLTDVLFEASGVVWILFDPLGWWFTALRRDIIAIFIQRPFFGTTGLRAGRSNRQPSADDWDNALRLEDDLRTVVELENSSRSRVEIHH